MSDETTLPVNREKVKAVQPSLPPPIEFTYLGVRISARSFRVANIMKRVVRALPAEHRHFIGEIEERNGSFGRWRTTWIGRWYMPGMGTITDRMSDTMADVLSEI